MVTIIEGCNKNCTFCIVPKTRGPERSRPLADILRRGRATCWTSGSRRSSCLGQTVNHWREPGGDLDFADLLEAVAGIARRRSGCASSPPILATSRRGWWSRWGCTPTSAPTSTCRSSRARIGCCGGWGADTLARNTSIWRPSSVRRGRISPSRPTSSSAFPERTRATSRRLSISCAGLRFSAIYAFKYSPRPGTAAPRARRRRPRRCRLRAAAAALRAPGSDPAARSTRISSDRTFEVLVTGWGKHEGSQTGRTACNRSVPFDDRRRASSPWGAVARVAIESAYAYSLVGRQILSGSDRQTPSLAAPCSSGSLQLDPCLTMRPE